MSKKSVLLLCLVLLAAGTASAQSYSTPVAPQFTVTITPQADHFIRGKLDDLGIRGAFTFTQADTAGGASVADHNDDGFPDQLSMSFDEASGGEDFPWTFVDVGSYASAGENLAVGTYENAARDHIFDNAGNVLDSGFNHTGCDDVGTFTISAFQYERQNVGFENNPVWVFHVTAASLTIVTACEVGGDTARFDIVYTDTAKGGEPGDGDGGGDDGGDDPEPVPPPPFQIVLPTTLGIEPVVIANAASQKVSFTTAIDSTFNADVDLWVETTASENAGLTASINPTVIPAPGMGEGEITINTGAMTLPGTYDVTVYARSGETVSSSNFRVLLDCTPPTILGIHQPQSLTADDGDSITLETTPSGSGPFLYQWYRGERGMTSNPVLSANESKLIIAARESTRYWVRVSNACGNFDSNTAAVKITGALAGPVKRRARH